MVALSPGCRRHSSAENQPWPPATSSSAVGSVGSLNAFATSGADSRASSNCPRM